MGSSPTFMRAAPVPRTLRSRRIQRGFAQGPFRGYPHRPVLHVHACISCGSRKLARYVAAPEPFILERIPALRGVTIKLVRCWACGLAFFEPRLEGPELTVLYAGYRGPEYQRMRQRHEPGYTPEVNASIGTGAREIASRTENMRELLVGHVAFAEVRSVLDYGGDRGQYIPAEASAARRVVYDISGTQPLDGMIGVRDWSAVKGQTFDLVLCNHVLEHVTSPRQTLEDVVSVTHEGSWLYLEVPRESPFDTLRDRRVSAAFKRAILEIPALANLKHASRGLRKMHEHVTLFSPRSLARAVEVAGLEVVDLRASALDLGHTTMEVISCLARRAAARA